MVVLKSKKNGSKTKSSIRNKTKFKSKTKSRTRKLMKGGASPPKSTKSSKISPNSGSPKVYVNNGSPVKPSTTGSRFALEHGRRAHNSRVGDFLKPQRIGFAKNLNYQVIRTPLGVPRALVKATPVVGPPGKDVINWIKANQGVGVPVTITGPTPHGEFRKLGGPGDVIGLPEIQAMSNQERIRKGEFGFDPKPSDAPGGMTPTKQPYNLASSDTNYSSASPSLPNYSLASSGSKYYSASPSSGYDKASPSSTKYETASPSSGYDKASPSSTKYETASPSSGYDKASPSSTKYETASPSSTKYSLASSDPIYALASDRGVLEIHNPLYGEEKSAIAPNQGYFVGMQSSPEYGIASSGPKYPSASSVPASSSADYFDPSLKTVSGVSSESVPDWMEKNRGFVTKKGTGVGKNSGNYTVFVPPRPLYTEVNKTLPRKTLTATQPQGPLYPGPVLNDLPYALPTIPTGTEYITVGDLSPSRYLPSTTTPENYAEITGNYANVYNVSKFKRPSNLKPGEGYANLKRPASEPEYVNIKSRNSGQYFNVAPKSFTPSINNNGRSALNRAIRASLKNDYNITRDVYNPNSMRTTYN